jgi:hypothetical protein
VCFFRSFVSFEDACAIVSANEIPDKRAYRKWQDRPVNLPAAPETEYTPHWKSWHHFLGKEVPNKSQTKKLTPAERQRKSRDSKKRKTEEQAGPSNIRPSDNHEGPPSLPNPPLSASRSSSPDSTALATPHGAAPNISDAPSRNDVASVPECVEPDPPPPVEALNTTQPGPDSPTEVANNSHSLFRDAHWESETPLGSILRRSRRSNQDQEPTEVGSDNPKARTVRRHVATVGELVGKLAKGDKEQMLVLVEKLKVRVRFCIPVAFSTLMYVHGPSTRNVHKPYVFFYLQGERT